MYGLKYVFPAVIGSKTRGMPTAYAAAPLKDHLTIASDEVLPVWPTPDGPITGFAVVPLYRSVPVAAARDSALYELLALVDAIRFGRSREHAIAIELLGRRLGNLTASL